MSRGMMEAVEREYARYRRIGADAIDQMLPEELTATHGGSLSVATLVWHVSGNLESRYTDFLTSDGEKPWRHRESEFETRTVSPTEVREKWSRGWDVLEGTLAGLDDEDLRREVFIRGTPLSAHEALIRSLAHVSYHVGQIVFVAKGLRGEDWRYLSIPPGQSPEVNSESKPRTN